jgi:hypothetical protein
MFTNGWLYGALRLEPIIFQCNAHSLCSRLNSSGCRNAMRQDIDSDGAGLNVGPLMLILGERDSAAVTADTPASWL